MAFFRFGMSLFEIKPMVLVYRGDLEFGYVWRQIVGLNFNTADF
jgi:hypothetical protein